MTEIRPRFTPSPTGYLHIGGLRTALYNYLFAKVNQGKMVLRIEDTDRARFVEGAIEGLIQSLKRAGIDYDEGVFMEDGKVVEKRDYGPYIQSERLNIYRKYVGQLLEGGHAYYCFCFKDRLDRLKEEQKIEGQALRYGGLCRPVPLEEARERIARGEKVVVRLKLPENMDIKFHDAVRGNITINTDKTDDQVLMKSDGFPTYHMAVVVDDHLIKITHIVRGEGWLPSTLKHIYLYDCLGWEKPRYVHLPGVLNSDHKKLSEHQGDVSVGDFKNRGYLPEGLINYLALVSWSPRDNEEILSMKDLIDQFSFGQVSKAGGVFDENELDWANAHYTKELPTDDLVDLSIPELIKAGLISQDFAQGRRDWLKLLLETVRESPSRIEEVPEKTAFLSGDLEVTGEETEDQLVSGQTKDLLGASKGELETADQVDEEFVKIVMKRIQKKTGIKGKSLYMPTRAAIIGNVHGPEFSNIMELLGKDRMLERINQILSRQLKGGA